MLGLEPARGITNTTGSNNRFSIFEIYWGQKHTRKGLWSIQLDRVTEMQRWAENIKNVQEDERIKLAIITANNHYAGFGPGSVNVFRNMLELPEAKWQEREEGQGAGATTSSISGA